MDYEDLQLEREQQHIDYYIEQMERQAEIEEDV
jgi:hypothetical protein